MIYFCASVQHAARWCVRVSLTRSHRVDLSGLLHSSSGNRVTLATLLNCCGKSLARSRSNSSQHVASEKPVYCGTSILKYMNAQCNTSSYQELSNSVLRALASQAHEYKHRPRTDARETGHSRRRSPCLAARARPVELMTDDWRGPAWWPERLCVSHDRSCGAAGPCRILRGVQPQGMRQC